MSTLPPYFIVSCSQTHLPNHILPTSPKHLFDFFIGQQLYHHRTRNVIIVIFVFFDIQQTYQNPVTHANILVFRVFWCPIITYYSIFSHVTTDAPPPRAPSLEGYGEAGGYVSKNKYQKSLFPKRPTDRHRESPLQRGTAKPGGMYPKTNTQSHYRWPL